MNIFSRFKRNEDGSVAVEFALISTVFIMFVVGVYASGFYFLTLNRLQYGTEVAARYAAVHDNTPVSDLQDIVSDSLSILSYDPSALTVAVNYTTSNGISFAEVTSSYQFTTQLPFFTEAASNYNLQTVSRMAIN